MQPRTCAAPVSPSSQGETTPVSQRTNPLATGAGWARTAVRMAGTSVVACCVVKTVASMIVVGSTPFVARYARSGA